MFREGSPALARANPASHAHQRPFSGRCETFCWRDGTENLINSAKTATRSPFRKLRVANEQFGKDFSEVHIAHAAHTAHTAHAAHAAHATHATHAAAHVGAAGLGSRLRLLGNHGLRGED